MISAAALKTLYDLNRRVLEANTNGVSHQESLAGPAAGNCCNWVVGHIVASRNHVLRLVGEEPVVDEATLAAYQRGSEPLRDGSRAREFDQLLRDFARSQERLDAALSSASNEQLAAPVPEGVPKFGDGTVGTALAMLHFHEAYHIGQTGLLRRLAGKPGAIK